MDLVTPARTWAVSEQAATAAVAADPAAAGPSSGPVGEPTARMPLLQRVVMFCSVAGPFAGLVAAIALLWRGSAAGAGGIGWPEVVAMVVMYAATGMGVTLGFHRLLTHRAFETPRAVRYALAILASSGGQGMCIRWCATHRRHHQRADRDGDPHSPHVHAGDGLRGWLRGMWHAHVAWCFDADAPDTARSIPDLLADRPLMLIDRLYFLWVALGLLVPGVALGAWYGTWGGFWSGVVWGGVVRIAVLQHVTWSINSVCHVWGGRPYESGDHSRNNPIFGVLAFGEGWHNNHHAFPTSARHGLRWWQFDMSWLVIRAMSAVGLAWNVRLPAESALAAKRRVPAQHGSATFR